METLKGVAILNVLDIIKFFMGAGLDHIYAKIFVAKFVFSKNYARIK